MHFKNSVYVFVGFFKFYISKLLDFLSKGHVEQVPVADGGRQAAGLRD